MNEIIRKLMETGKKDAFNSMEELLVAAEEIGIEKKDLEAALENFNGFPLDDDDLDAIVGGFGIATPYHANISRFSGRKRF